jgi:DNA-binding MarR family transcriptional regulator
MTGTPYRLHQSLGYQLSVTSRMQERRLEDKLKALGLTRITWCVLLAVGNEGLTQPSEIADFVGMDRTATSRALRQMEAAGLVGRASGTGDRRTTQVALTAAGQARLDAGTPLAVASNEVLRSRLSAAEHAELAELLEKLRGGEAKRLKGL